MSKHCQHNAKTLPKRFQSTSKTLLKVLLQDYNCEIGACLLQLKERQDSAVQARMQVLTLEALSLSGRTMLNPANHRAIVNSRLDDATPVAQKPGKAFYQGLLVGCLLCLRSEKRSLRFSATITDPS